MLLPASFNLPVASDSQDAVLQVCPVARLKYSEYWTWWAMVKGHTGQASFVWIKNSMFMRRLKLMSL